jgi:hypothetical protein
MSGYALHSEKVRERNKAILRNVGLSENLPAKALG